MVRSVRRRRSIDNRESGGVIAAQGGGEGEQVTPEHGGRDGVVVIVACKHDIERRAEPLSADDVHVDE